MVAVAPITAESGIQQLTRAEGRAMGDREARRVLGVGVDEFLRRLDADRLDLADPDVLGLVMLVPFARS